MILPAFLGAVKNPSAASSLLTGLVSYWKLDEASGTRYDSHGSYHLTDNNTVGQGAGKLGNAADLEASSSQYLSHAGFAWPTAWTLSLWAKVESFADSYMALFSRDGGAPRAQATLYVKSNGKLAAYIDGTTNYDGSGAVTLTTSTWYHVVWSYSAATGIQVWVNGSVDIDTADSVTPETQSVPVNVGRDAYNSSRLFDGLIDAVGLWSRVLTSDERNALYGSGSGLEYPFSFFLPTDISGLALWLDASDASTLFQNSNGTTAATADGDPVGYWGDKSGNGRHATQATGSKRPSLSLTGLGGHPGVADDNSDDELDFTSLALSSFTIFLAGKEATVNGLANYWLGGNAQGLYLGLPFLSLGYGGYDGTNLRAATGNATAFGVYTFLNASLRQDGTAPSYAATDTLTGLTVSRLFSRTDTSSNRGGANLGEVLVYNSTLSADNRAAVEAYLRSKWGTP